MDKDLERRVTMISEAVSGLKYYEWLRIKMAIDKKFSSESSKVRLENPEELKNAIQVEF